MIQLRLLSREAHAFGCGKLLEAFGRRIHFHFQLVDDQRRPPVLHGRDDALGRQGLLRLHLQLCAFVVRAGASERHALIELLALQAHPGVRQSGARGFELEACRRSFLQKIGIGALGDHGIRLHGGSGADEDAFHARLRLHREPSDLARDQCARPAHLNEHFAPMNLVDPQHGLRDGRCGGLQARERDSCNEHQRHPTAHDREPSGALASGQIRSMHIHGRRCCMARTRPLLLITPWIFWSQRAPADPMRPAHLRLWNCAPESRIARAPRASPERVRQELQ